MPDTSLFQDLESNKQTLSKASIREALLAETKFHLGWNVFAGVTFLILAITLIVVIVRNFYLPALLVAIFLLVMVGYFTYAGIQGVKEYSALNNGAFCVKIDTLASKKSVDRSDRRVSSYHFHVEDIFVFESGLRFVRNRVTPMQKDLTSGASVGDVYYLVLLDHKPDKPRYIYNTKSFEYRER
ncbi:MAG: hypothetical protein E7625_04695 [Ruminococcaceae bacterium]|nr:hypothetical protein [Oscillospiraceae bacterium]